MGDKARDIPTNRPSAPDPRAERRFTLLKGAHAWIFRCAPGDEQSVLRAARAISARRHSGLDGFDVAALALQIGQRYGPPAPPSFAPSS